MSTSALAQYKVQYIDPQFAASYGHLTLSESGSVYGNFSSGSLSGVPFRWNSGKTTPLTEIPSNRTPFQILAVNGSDALAGHIGVDGDAVSVAAVWTENYLHYLDSPGRNHNPASINDNGVSAGSVTVNFTDKAVVWTGTNIALLPDLSDGNGTSFAGSINNNGTIAGYSTDSRGKVAVFWDEFGVHSIGRIGLCESGGNESFASDINSFGQIVGTAVVGCSGKPKAFLFQHSGLKVLDTFGDESDSAATAISDNGSIVGHINGLAVIWTPDGRPRLLTDLLEVNSGYGEVTLNYAHAINSNGQILATGTCTASDCFAGYFLLSPVPEPNSTLLLISGTVLLLVALKRSIAATEADA